MEPSIILVDTSVIIDFIRKTNKTTTFFYSICSNFTPAISVITQFELLVGMNDRNSVFTNQFLEELEIITLDTSISKKASTIYGELKIKNKLIGLADLFIASSSIVKNYPLATLNVNHFNRIESLELFET
ncbi:MAG: type II toxin-antitoxin system VapC family toxin [Bacteroidetes bacterium]|nr:type II toxin-antitoxin system VapC family toxin [Bacteroidota bacterium]